MIDVKIIIKKRESITIGDIYVIWSRLSSLEIMSVPFKKSRRHFHDVLQENKIYIQIKLKVGKQFFFVVRIQREITSPVRDVGCCCDRSCDGNPCFWYGNR